MITVTISTNSVRKTINNVDPYTRTLRSVFEEAGLDYTTKKIHYFGDPVTTDMLDKTFADNDILENAMFAAVVKADSAC